MGVCVCILLRKWLMFLSPPPNLLGLRCSLLLMINSQRAENKEAKKYLLSPCEPNWKTEGDGQGLGSEPGRTRREKGSSFFLTSCFRHGHLE